MDRRIIYYLPKLLTKTIALKIVFLVADIEENQLKLLIYTPFHSKNQKSNSIFKIFARKLQNRAVAPHGAV